MKADFDRVVQIVVMSWITLLFTVAWLPFVRSIMDGPSYEWGDTFLGMTFSGAGMAGDFWYVALKVALGVGLLYLGWRRPARRARLAIAGWLMLVFLDTLYSAVSAPEHFRFRGDTLGIDISLTVIAPLFDGLALLLAMWWAYRAARAPQVPFTRVNGWLLAIAVALLPIQYALLSQATGQEMRDVIGVLLTILGWFLFSASLAPWQSRSRSALAVR